MEAAVAASGAI